MNSQQLEKAGSLFVQRIKERMSDRNLNDTGEGAASLSYKVEGNKLIIEGVARLLFLEFGRRAGTYPPKDIIEAWVRRKLNVDDKDVKSVAFLISRKIFEKGTDILTDKTKGLQLELIIDELNNELFESVAEEQALSITDGIFKTWQSPN
jgi:hypothetical protein